MKNKVTTFCAHCRKTTMLICGIVIYRCPKCHRIILPSQVAEEMDRERDDSECERSGQQCT